MTSLSVTLKPDRENLGKTIKDMIPDHWPRWSPEFDLADQSVDRWLASLIEVDDLKDADIRV